MCEGAAARIYLAWFWVTMPTQAAYLKRDELLVV